MRVAPCIGLAVLALAVSAGGNAFRADDADDSRQVIVAAMRRVFAGPSPLILRAADGEAGETEKQRLLKVLTGMAAARPAHGGADSWKAKTDALVAAARDLVDGKDGARDRLRDASDCRACHLAHRGKGD